MHRHPVLAVALLVVAVATTTILWIGVAGTQSPWRPAVDSGDPMATGPVDETRCRACHADQAEDWRGSHHQRAMLVPGEDTVLGDFDNARFESDRETSVFFRRGDEYWIRTPDATGTPGEFRVAYTFGWAPLQQYLLEREDGRLQAFGVAWDTERQRWFHLHEGQGVDADHALHWSQPIQNANTRCIECHVTGFQPGYDAARDRFNGQWQAPGVGCQSCHGPAAGHLRWAKTRDDDPDKGFAGTPATRETETCGRCHGRRTPLGHPTDAATLEDAYLISPLRADLYQVDGKIRDEVFEYGSFTQSRKYPAGVECSDCHDPHSGRLQADGNAVCTRCHNPSATPVREGIRPDNLRATDYDSPAHHHHAPGSPGARCRSCHMPGRTYMGNDRRHDHSFSSPDPAQALALGHDDACLGCHTDQAAETLITRFRQWYPDHRPRDGGYARALHKARDGRPGAARALREQLDRDDLPAPRRAALIAELPDHPGPTARARLREALAHPQAPVRRADIESAPALLPPDRVDAVLAEAMDDPVRAVRITAAEQRLTLADQRGARLPAEPFREYEKVQRQLLANAEAHYNLANLYRLTGRDEQVETALQAALQRNPAFSPAIIAMAQWREHRGDPAAALQWLEDRLRRFPDDASLHHALGLARIRARRINAGVQALEQAHTLAPDNDTYAYVLAVAWHDTGEPERALALLREQRQRHPGNRSLRLALLRYLQPGEQRDVLLEQWTRINPRDPVLAQYP